MGHVREKGVGRKKRLGQLKAKRPDMPVDKAFLKLLEDMKLVGQVLYVKSDAGVLCDLTNLTQRELQKSILRPWDGVLLYSARVNFTILFY